jgi:hypothetical protein
MEHGGLPHLKKFIKSKILLQICIKPETVNTSGFFIYDFDGILCISK